MSISRELSKFIEPGGQLEYDNTTSGLSATTVKSAIDELNTLLGGGNVGSQATFNVYEFTATAAQTTFSLSSNHGQGSDITAGAFADGVVYIITGVGTTDFVTLYGASSNTVGVTFTATTDPGTGTGTAKVVADYIPGYIKVYLNGVFLSETDYVASDGDNIVLDTGADVGALLSVVVLDSFNTATQLRVLGVDAGAPDNSLVIDSSGNVVVAGWVTATGLLEASDGTNGEMQLGLGTQLTTGAATYDSSVRWNGLAGNLLFSQGAVEKMRITATGIDVTGTVTADGLVTQATANTYPASAAQIKSLAGDISYITNVGGAFLISNSSSSDQFVLSSAGNVGIGTSSPATLLNTKGAALTTTTDKREVLIEAYDDGVTDSAGALTGVTFRNSPTTYTAGSFNRTSGIYGINLDAAGYGRSMGLALYTSSIDGTATEKLRVDASGNVGIGCTPEDWDPVFDVLRIGKTGLLFSYDTAGDGMWLGSNAFYDDTLNDYKYISTDPASLYTQLNGTHSWSYAASGTANTQLTFSEAMRIDASGNLLVGKISDVNTANGITLRPDGGARFTSAGTGAFVQLAFFRNGSAGEVGSISTTSSATSYVTSSDQRLKENIADADDAGSKIDAIQVRKYDWKADGSHQDYGLVAQELQPIAPLAVSGDADSEEMMGVDYSKLVPMMLKEIQSLRARINAIESK